MLAPILIILIALALSTIVGGEEGFWNCLAGCVLGGLGGLLVWAITQ